MLLWTYILFITSNRCNLDLCGHRDRRPATRNRKSERRRTDIRVLRSKPIGGHTGRSRRRLGSYDIEKVNWVVCLQLYYTISSSFNKCMGDKDATPIKQIFEATLG